LEGRLYLEKMRDEERMGQGIKSEERANADEANRHSSEITHMMMRPKVILDFV
jgi:hypothetical protein